MRLGEIDRQILPLAVPSIFANISIPLIGFVDMAVAGHLDASAAGVSAATLIGALSIGSMLFDMLYWNFGFLRAGTGGITAQAYGRGDSRGEADTFSRAVGTGFVSGLALIALQWVFIPLAFLLVRCSPEVQAMATRYFEIRIWAAPAALSLMAFKGWFIGMQDGVSPMVSDLIVLAVNSLASIGLAFGFFGLPCLGYDGVAIGTVAAQYSALLFCSLTVLFKYRATFSGYGLRDALSSFQGSEIRRFFSVNGDLFVRSICFILLYSAFTVISARYGDVLLASGALIMKIMMFFSYFTDGFAYAGEALTGKYFGAGSRRMVHMTIRHVFAWSMSIAVVFMAFNAFCSQWMFRLFTDDASVAEASGRFIFWIVLMPLLGCPAFTWDGIYVGATATRPLRDSSILFVLVAMASWFIGIGVLNMSGGWHFFGFGPNAEAASGASAYGYAAMHILFAAYMMHLVVRFVFLQVAAKGLFPHE